MRFANPAEATGGSVGQRLGALRICKGCLGVLGGSWKALGVIGGPWGVLGVLGRAFEGLGESSGGPGALSGGSFGLLGRSLGVLGSLRELIEGPWRVLGELFRCPR